MNAPQGRLRFVDAEPFEVDHHPHETPLNLELEGWEGPLDVLLELARAQKVDLMALSITRLADQFLAFVRAAAEGQFSLAADYLVMAAWLTYLKSRLLLPKPAIEPDASAPPEEVARQLAARLARLDVVRRAADALEARPALGRDVFGRGDPEAATVVSLTLAQGDLQELMVTYASKRQQAESRGYSPPVARAWRLEEARDYLEHSLSRLIDWTALTDVVPRVDTTGPTQASLMASTLSAGLEYVREQRLDMRQGTPFSELMLRVRAE